VFWAQPAVIHGSKDSVLAGVYWGLYLQLCYSWIWAHSKVRLQICMPIHSYLEIELDKQMSQPKANHMLVKDDV